MWMNVKWNRLKMSRNKFKKPPRELHQEQWETMRSHNMGVRISILTESMPSRKVVFDNMNKGEENVSMDDNSINEFEPIQEVVSQAKDSDDDDDDDNDEDDAVEEVKSSVAHGTIMEQCTNKCKTAKIQRLQICTKKQKKTAQTKQPDEEEFDEEFFAKVDSELKAQ